jgi:SAM-dependent methyltransferase
MGSAETRVADLRGPRAVDARGRTERAERAERRALSHAGGQVRGATGSATDRQVLKAALTVDTDGSSVMAHVHGFHSYPARLHPDTASRLIAALSPPGGMVLDPFCGSGTVLVEARLLGRRGVGVDANPLAIELAWLKTLATTADQRAELLDAAARVVEHADARRRARSGPTHAYGPEDRELFDVHVLLELDGLNAGIRSLPSSGRRRALGLVLSAILTKVSRLAGDSASTHHLKTRRLAAGYTIKLFSKKATELAKRLAEFAERLPQRSPEPELHVGDARRLKGVRARSVDLVVSSPPYPGVYDYVAHHATRLRWLGLDAARLERDELGARRRLARLDHSEAVKRWQDELRPCLAEMARVIKPNGAAALVIADSVAGGQAVRAAEWLGALAPRAGLRVAAQASQQRPHFHAPTSRAFRASPRHEHLFLLRG